MNEHELNPNIILSCEFNHAAETANRADEDRVKVFRYYLAIVGTLIVTLVLVDLANEFHLFIVGALFAGLVFLGFMSLLKLAKLRLAWIDSVKAMHQIKDYYIQKCGDIQLEKAFRWRNKTVPTSGKKWTVAFLMATTIAFLSGLSTGGVVFFWGLAVAGKTLILPIVFMGFFVFIGQLLIWFRICPNKL